MAKSRKGSGTRGKSKEELEKIGKATQFTSTNQPTKRRSGRQLNALLKQMLSMKELKINITAKKRNGEVVERQVDYKNNNRNETINHAIVGTLLEMALSGDLQAIKEVFDRVEGKAYQHKDADVVINNDNADGSTQNYQIIFAGPTRPPYTTEEEVEEAHGLPPVD